MALAQRGVVLVASGDALHRRESAIDQQHLGRLVARQPDRLVEQRLVADHLAGAAAGIGADDEHRLGVVDPAREAAAREAAEHHRMDRADARAGQHREHRLRDHRHVDQHAIALPGSERLQAGRHPIHFGMQFREAVDALDTGLGRYADQRVLRRSRREVPVHGVVAQVRAAAGEPARERCPARIADAVERVLPVDQRRLLGPERVAIGQRATVKVGVGRGSRRGHRDSVPWVTHHRCGGGCPLAADQPSPACRAACSRCRSTDRAACSRVMRRCGSSASTPRLSSRSTSSTLLPTG